MSAPDATLMSVFQATWGSSLAGLSTAPALAPELLEAWEAARAARDPHALAAEAPSVLRALCSWLWSRNQFLAIAPQDELRLASLVERALSGLARPGGAAAALALHRRELADFVRARLGDPPREVTSAEYPPGLQLEVLGLVGRALAAPLLDIGCGPAAQLVRFLRDEGMAAEGLDREAPDDVGIRADWLTFDYAARGWATVLSHQGFSLHFLHRHHAPGDTAYAYARAYMAIVRALPPGGLFAYAPGLPFIEALLDPAVYRVHRVPFADALRVPALRDVEARTGLSLSHAAHVERIV